MWIRGVPQSRIALEMFDVLFYFNKAAVERRVECNTTTLGFSAMQIHLSL